MYKIVIMPIKALCLKITDGKIDTLNSALLAVSSYDFNMSVLGGIAVKSLFSFADTLEKNDADAFNNKIAGKIKAFVSSIPTNIKTLYICCDSGESRSTAMAACVLRYNRVSDYEIWDNPHYRPNALVYYLLCRAMHIPVTKLGVRYRVRRNENALKTAINKNRK